MWLKHFAPQREPDERMKHCGRVCVLVTCFSKGNNPAVWGMRMSLFFQPRYNLEWDSWCEAGWGSYTFYLGNGYVRFSQWGQSFTLWQYSLAVSPLWAHRQPNCPSTTKKNPKKPTKQEKSKQETAESVISVAIKGPSKLSALLHPHRP